MAPFEALYGQRCRTPLSWSQTGEHKIFGPELVVEAKEKVKVVQENLRATQSWQKSYFDKRGNLWNSMVVIMFIYGSHQLEAFNTSESEENWPLVISDHMKSSKNVDQLLIDCDSLRSSLQSMMSFTYLNSSDVSEFQRRSLNVKMRMGRPGPGLGPGPHGLKVIFWGHGPTQINVFAYGLDGPMGIMGRPNQKS